MPHEIKGFILLVVIGGLIWWMIILVLNDYATHWIDDREEDIKDYLNDKHMKLSVYSYYDCPPCEVRYSLHSYSNITPKYLSSRKAKRLIVKLRRGNITRLRLLEYVDTYGKYIHKAKPKF